VLDPSIGLVPVDASNESLVTQNNYLYCGEQFDPDLGLYFLRARYMDTDRGRFWTMDVWEGVIRDPASLHKYLYCEANPVNWIDPSGHLTLKEILGVAAIINTLISAGTSVITTALLNPEADVSDFVVAFGAGGIAGAIGSLPALDPLGSFVGGFISSAHGAIKKGCNASEVLYIATVGGLVAGGMPLAMALKYPGFATFLETFGGGLVTGVAVGTVQKLSDEYLGLRCLM
jgi:RHS repeat-associated protein